MKRIHPLHILVIPGSPSEFCPIKPPNFPIQIMASFNGGGLDGIFFILLNFFKRITHSYFVIASSQLLSWLILHILVIQKILQGKTHVKVIIFLNDLHFLIVISLLKILASVSCEMIRYSTSSHAISPFPLHLLHSQFNSFSTQLVPINKLLI